MRICLGLPGRPCNERIKDRRRCPDCERERNRIRHAARYRRLHGPPLPSRGLAARLDVAGRRRRRDLVATAIVDSYADGGGPPIRILAERHGVAVGTVHAILVAAGVDRRTPGRPKS